MIVNYLEDTSLAWNPFANKNIPTTKDKTSGLMSAISYSNFEFVWKYMGKTFIISRNLGNAAIRIPRILSHVGENFPHSVKNYANYTKLLALVSVPISLYDLEAVAKKIFKSISDKDAEGVALNTLSFSIIALDVIDSIATFISARIAIAGLEPIQLLSTLGLPLPLAMSSMGIVSRTIQIAKSHHLFTKINREIKNQPKDSLKPQVKVFIEEILMENGAVSEKKKAALLRYAPQTVFSELVLLHKEMNSFMAFLPLTERKIHVINTGFEKVQSKLNEKMKLDMVGITANLTLLFAMGLFSIGAAGATPFLLVSTGFALRIGTTFYQDYTK